MISRSLCGIQARNSRPFLPSSRTPMAASSNVDGSGTGTAVEVTVIAPSTSDSIGMLIRSGCCPRLDQISWLRNYPGGTKVTPAQDAGIDVKQHMTQADRAAGRHSDAQKGAVEVGDDKGGPVGGVDPRAEERVADEDVRGERRRCRGKVDSRIRCRNAERKTLDDHVRRAGVRQRHVQEVARGAGVDRDRLDRHDQARLGSGASKIDAEAMATANVVRRTKRIVRITVFSARKCGLNTHAHVIPSDQRTLTDAFRSVCGRSAHR